MSDISTSGGVALNTTNNISPDETNNSLKKKNNDDDHSSINPVKKLRLEETEFSDNNVQPSSSSNFSLPLSPQSEQTASTSSSTGSVTSEWQNMLKDSKDNRIPIPYNDFQNPRQLLSHLIPSIDIHKLPSNLDDVDICRLIYQLMATSEGDSDVENMPNPIHVSDLFIIQREKLKEFNTIEQCVDLIEKSENIIVLTGAGCSVSCGIPDFRSRDGVYARLRVDFPDLPDPQAMFDIFYFDHDPRPFFKFAKEIYPGQFKPSLSHLFIRKLEENQKLLRNYTQNIDTLEMTAGIEKVIQCHGSFATATCTTCKIQVDADHIREKILNQEIPYCEKCNLENNKSEESSELQNLEINNTEKVENNGINGEIGENDHIITDNSERLVYKKNNSAGILKPDIVFFGEGLPELYHKSIVEDKVKCDLLIVIGSSLKVKPVANIPHLLPESVPQILINRESLKHLNFDIELLGDCDVIVNEILLRLEEKRTKNWSNICQNNQRLNEICDEEAESLLFQSGNHNDLSDDQSNSPDHSTIIVNAETVNTEEKSSEEPKENEISNNNETNNVNNKKYTKDYLKENSFLYLKPNMYVFHGAEIQLKHARRKLKKLRVDTVKDSVSDEDSDEDSSDLTDDSEDSDDDEVTEREQNQNSENSEKSENKNEITEEVNNSNDIKQENKEQKKNLPEGSNNENINNSEDEESDDEESDDEDFEDEDEDDDDKDKSSSDEEGEGEDNKDLNSKKKLIDFFNGDIDDEDDDEDFTPDETSFRLENNLELFR